MTSKYMRMDECGCKAMVYNPMEDSPGLPREYLLDFLYSLGKLTKKTEN